MFIKSLKIENFKGYHGSANNLEFNTPDGKTEGSGLNIFVGENNTGKSTIFEIMDFIRDGTKKKIEDLLSRTNSENPPKSLSAEIIFTGNLDTVINAHLQKSKIKKYLYIENDIQYFKVKREGKKGERNKCDIFFWDNKEKKFIKKRNYKNESFKKLYENNFIWADTNPTDEAKFGTTTFCGSLLSKIANDYKNSEEYKELMKSFKNIFNQSDSELRKKISDVERQVKDILAKQFGDADIKFQFDEPQVEKFFKTISIMVNDGINLSMEEKGHGMQRAIALSLLQAYAEFAYNGHDSGDSKPFYLFIDEPEICLHPSGQQKLLDALMTLSKKRQIFIATHSPYLLSSPHLKEAGLFIFTKTDNKSSIDKVKTPGLFKWSPSWGEINYKAYNLATVELHNELYGALKNKLEDIVGKKGIESKEFDDWLVEQKLEKSKEWTIEKSNKSNKLIKVTLPTFIRHHIHHPENVTMREKKYSEEELENSISVMIDILEKFNETKERENK